MEIRYNNCEFGIGIRIIGGIEYHRVFYNIFIREILPDGLACQDGRLNEGDQLLAINDVSCIQILKEKAIELLRSACASGCVKLLVKKYDDKINKQFIELFEIEKILNICSDDEDGGVDEDEEIEQHQQSSNNLINSSLLNTVVDDDDDEDETKIYDENDDRFINEITDSNNNIQKLLTSQYLSDPNLHYSNHKNNQDQYFIRASKAALLEQQYLNLNGENEREAFIEEIKRLQTELIERDKTCSSYKEQLFELQQKVCEYLNEIMQLRAKLSVAEDCQKEAFKIEQEYKQIVKFLKMNLNKTANASIQRASP